MPRRRARLSVLVRERRSAQNGPPGLGRLGRVLVTISPARWSKPSAASSSTRAPRTRFTTMSSVPYLRAAKGGAHVDAFLYGYVSELYTSPRHGAVDPA